MRDKVCFGVASGLLVAAIVLAAVLFGTATMFGERDLSDIPQSAKQLAPEAVSTVSAGATVRPSGD